MKMLGAAGMALLCPDMSSREPFQSNGSRQTASCTSVALAMAQVNRPTRFFGGEWLQQQVGHVQAIKMWKKKNNFHSNFISVNRTHKWNEWKLTLPKPQHRKGKADAFDVLRKRTNEAAVGRGETRTSGHHPTYLGAPPLERKTLASASGNPQCDVGIPLIHLNLAHQKWLQGGGGSTKAGWLTRTTCFQPRGLKTNQNCNLSTELRRNPHFSIGIDLFALKTRRLTTHATAQNIIARVFSLSPSLATVETQPL